MRPYFPFGDRTHFPAWRTWPGLTSPATAALLGWTSAAGAPAGSAAAFASVRAAGAAFFSAAGCEWPVAAHAPTDTDVAAATTPAATAMVLIRFTGCSPCIGLDAETVRGPERRETMLHQA